jgi:hypothetical protein
MDNDAYDVIASAADLLGDAARFIRNQALGVYGIRMAVRLEAEQRRLNAVAEATRREAWVKEYR